MCPVSVCVHPALTPGGVGALAVCDPRSTSVTTVALPARVATVACRDDSRG
jgi:hypothetical protein